MKAKKPNAVNIWVMVKTARDAGLDPRTEWAKKGTREFTFFNLVEINLRLSDEAAAIRKYAKEIGEEYVFADRKYKPGYDSYGTLYLGPNDR